MEVMKIPQNKLHEINASLNISTVIVILQFMGYKIYPGKKFKLREEKTPSASVRADGHIKDFGGDFSGDLIALLREYHNMSFEEAVRYIATCLGVTI